MSRSRIVIVSPATASDNNGNWRTASRWAGFLREDAEATVVPAWDGEPADAMIALHARKSADSIARWHAARGPASLALVLTGTDLYRDVGHDANADRSLQDAGHLVVLQPLGVRGLVPALRGKAMVIVQSAPAPASTPTRGAAPGSRRPFVVVGHLRAEKDPATLWQAVRRLGDVPGLRIEHVGAALDPDLGAAADATAAACPWYRWRGELPHDRTLALIADAAALLHPSRMEGGAHVVIEAVRAGVPVIASDIDGNVGLLGEDYAGYFPVGDACALAAAVRRCGEDIAWRSELGRHCARLAPQFAPEIEAAAVRALASRLTRVAQR